MTRSQTLSVTIRAPFDRVWRFVSDPANLHLWTVDFALEPPEPVGRVYRVRTPRGPLDVWVETDRERGIIDFHFGRDGRYQVSPSRLVSRPGTGDVVYALTQREPPDAPPGLFERLVANVERELEILRALLESEGAGTSSP